MRHKPAPAVPVACPPWRPSADLIRSLAQLLTNISGRQRRAQRMAHRADPAAGPDVSVIITDEEDSEDV